MLDMIYQDFMKGFNEGLQHQWYDDYIIGAIYLCMGLFLLYKLLKFVYSHKFKIIVPTSRENEIWLRKSKKICDSLFRRDLIHKQEG